MNRYFLTNILMVACCAYVIYAIGTYELLANASDWVAGMTAVAAVTMFWLGLYEMGVKIKEYFTKKTK